MDRYGLLGKGVTLSLSKKIHEEAAKILGLEISYDILEVSSEEKLKYYLGELRSGIWKGFNVTTPYKTLVIPYLDQVISGSVNTVWCQNRQLFGVSTDGLGFEKGLKILNHSFNFNRSDRITEPNYKENNPSNSEHFDVGFIGSGGAVLGILEYLKATNSHALKKPVSLLVRDLNSDSVRRISEFSKRNFLKVFLSDSSAEFSKRIVSVCADQASDAFILINAIPSKFQAPWNMEDLISSLPKAVNYYDLTYPPILSDFYGKATSHFHFFTDGVPMLIEQARQSQMIWWGKSPSFEVLFKKFGQN